MKIVFFETSEEDKNFFAEKLPQEQLTFYPHKLSVENVDEAKDAEIICCRNGSECSQDVLSKLPSVKLLSTRSTGYDHIDLEYCKSHGITVCNVPEYGKYTVAEHTMALILAISRKIIQSVDRTRRGDFRLEGLTGFELYGKTLGIVGVGSIGKAVIRLARCFGMKVLAMTAHPDEQLAKELGFTYVDLPTLLQESDIVSLHVPYTKQTHHLINKQNIYLFKRGSVLINTARGGVVDTEAIVMGLDQGILKAAGLDVLEEECAIMDETQLMTSEFLKTCDLKTQLLNHVLLQRENVIITPHNAFNSTEALRRILDVTVENITLFLRGRPQNIVV
jgi:D-lactate dehydrogenase